ncbi:SitI3 family protein [Archangium sp.]|uniref:SitI3 family protein n=1 Tax=Archangium sp. TaxID=1872627 RepID=UPI00286C7C9F|nr:SitI3 family protein [Archangium sp.]
MALEYTLESSTKMTPTQAMDLLASSLHELAWGEERFVLYDPTVTICATQSLSMTRKVIERGFRFVPDLSVEFRFVSNSDYECFRETMLLATMLLLEHVQDSVLLFNGEIIVLQRFGGKLVLNSEYHIFEDDDWLRSRLSLPFERRPLPSPLM